VKVCAGKEKNDQQSADQGFPKPATTAAMHCNPKSVTHPPSPVPPFLLDRTYHSSKTNFAN